MAPRPNPKIAAALQAMTEFGIPEAKVKRALKKLLKLFDKNWQLIEEENYRALLDAIFEEGDDFEVFFSLYFYPSPLWLRTHCKLTSIVGFYLTGARTTKEKQESECT
jgi:hypothetical protein